MPLPVPQIDKTHRCRSRLSGALASVEAIIKADSVESFNCHIEQQAPFIIEDLTAALDYIRRAQTAVEAVRAIARCEAAEAGQARAA